VLASNAAIHCPVPSGSVHTPAHAAQGTDNAANTNAMQRFGTLAPLNGGQRGERLFRRSDHAHRRGAGRTGLLDLGFQRRDETLADLSGALRKTIFCHRVVPVTGSLS
jgi:hypothetical protein